MPVPRPFLRRFSATLHLVLLGALLGPGEFAAGEDDAERLRKSLEDEHVDGVDLWIYNDLDEAFAASRRTRKPLFVTFRCVPCNACKGFDAEVAKGSEAIRKLARDKFVAVRQVEMKGVDLSLFQFDHDLNWAAMFVNADGIVYARYGTQSAAGPDAYNSIEGLEKTMRRVLKLHENYPSNVAELKGKRGPKKPYRTALEMPGLRNKEKFRDSTTRRNCIHCHNIHDAEHFHAQGSGQFKEDMLWRYPLPDNLGLSIDGKDGRRIQRVESDSAAARAGVQAGEEVTHVDGQAITSIADIQWALHQLPNTDATVAVRTSKTGKHELRVGAGWKKTDISWRGSLWSLQPRLRVWAPQARPEDRRKYSIPRDRSGLVVRWINRKEPGGQAAFRAGLREGDFIIALAGKPVDMTPQRFNLHVKLNYKVGQKLPLTVLREGEKREVTIELVE